MAQHDGEGGGGFGQPPGGGFGDGQGFGSPPGSQPQRGVGSPSATYGQGGPFGGAPGYGSAPIVPSAPGYGYGVDPLTPPDAYKTAGVLMMISGILNFMVAGTIVLALLLTLLFACISPIWMAALGVAVFEVVVGIQAMQGNRSSNAKVAAILGLVAGVMCSNVFSVVLEIAALVMLSKPEVQRFIG
ncbi:MAG: hypothetical protein ACFCGT_21060 [Sandaracinaceae bacterium]